MKVKKKRYFKLANNYENEEKIVETFGGLTDNKMLYVSLLKYKYIN